VKRPGVLRWVLGFYIHTAHATAQLLAPTTTIPLLVLASRRDAGAWH
jgi:hypothetical protein